MKRQKEIADLDFNNLPSHVKPIIDYDGSIIEGWYIDSKKLVVYKLNSNNELEVRKPYLNKCNSGKNKWKNGYYKIHINKSVYNFHWLLAKAFVPGYEFELVVDHIDNDSTNNDILNLQWITRGENTKKYWDSCTEEEKEKYTDKYRNEIKKAHEEGKYKEHLAKLNEWHYRKGEVNKDENN